MNRGCIILIILAVILCIGIVVFYLTMGNKDNYTKTTPNLTSFIQGMPKTALHMHLEGSLEAPMAYKFAKKYNMLPLKVPKAGGGIITVNTLEELEKVYQFNDLESFLNVYNTLATTLKQKEDFTDLAWAYCQKALSENIRHAEIFFDPQTHTSRGLSFADVADGIQAGLEQGRKQGLSIQLFCSLLRDHKVGDESDLGDMNAKRPNSDPTAWTTVKQAVEYNKTTEMAGGTPGARPASYFIPSLALDNDEVGFPPKLFTGVYRYGRENGMMGVAHAGEEGPPNYIWEAIDNLHVFRIDHAVRSIEDPELVSYMATPQNNEQMQMAFGEPHPLPATVCPLSNYKLKVFADPTKTDIIQMLDLGIMATVNSDDPAYFGGYVTENYMFLLKYLNPKVAKGRPINLADIRRLCLNGFNASLLSQSKKLSYLKEVNNYFLTTPGLLFNDFRDKY